MKLQIGYLTVSGHHGQATFTQDTEALFDWRETGGYWYTISPECDWDIPAKLLDVDLSVRAIYKVMLQEGGKITLERTTDKEK